MGLIHPESTQEDMEDLYHDVYQLWRLSRRGQCKVATKEHLCREILNSIKECLRIKWPSTQPEGELRKLPADVPKPDHCTEFAAAIHQTYKKFTAAKQDSCKGMVALVRDAHWWALVPVALLKEKMEWMSCSINLW